MSDDSRSETVMQIADTNGQNLQYAEFGDRFMAFLVDSILQLPLLLPFLWLLLREDFQAAGGDVLVLAPTSPCTGNRVQGAQHRHPCRLRECLFGRHSPKSAPG